MAMKARYTVIDGEIIAEKRGGVRSHYVPDPLDSTVALLDSTQAQTDTFSYWPDGENNARTGTTATPFRFVGAGGYYRDSGTRDYVRARVPSTQTARSLTRDPIGFDGRDRNLYRYVACRPVSLVATTGKSCSGPPCSYNNKLSQAMQKCIEDCTGKPDFAACLTKCLGKKGNDWIRDIICHYLACQQYGGSDQC